VTESHRESGRIIVVVDTTAVYPDVMMSRIGWMQLLSLCARGDIDLAISEVVLKEAARHWADGARTAWHSAQESRAKFIAGQERLRTLGFAIPRSVPELPGQPEIDEGDYYRRMLDKLTALGVTVLPLPQVRVEHILDRDLTSRRPFAKNGKGFRDTLIWVTVVELMRSLDDSHAVYFVTDNVSDYCTPDGGLHQDLAEDVKELPPTLHHVRSINDLLGHDDFKPLVTSLETTVEALAVLLDEVTASEPPEADMPTVADIVTSALVSAAEELAYEDVLTTNGMSSGIDLTQFSVPAVIGSPSIAYVEPYEASVDWQTYETFDDTTLLLQGSISADLSIEGLVEKADYAALGPDEVELVDWDWSDSAAQVVAHVNARLTFQLRVEIGVGVEYVEFETAEPA
jgi:hypothetical protein